MRPASLVLLISGVGLLLGTAAVASFKIPCRQMSFTNSDNNGMHIHTHCNVWGQPLLAICSTYVPADANGRLEGTTIELGPYPNSVRQGKWKRAFQESGKPIVESDIWYLDGREVSAADWEQRQ